MSPRQAPFRDARQPSAFGLEEIEPPVEEDVIQERPRALALRLGVREPPSAQCPHNGSKDEATDEHRDQPPSGHSHSLSR
jgi:hypothetical protein